MKLMRYGPAGSERPALLDEDGGVRDLTGHVGDIGGSELDAETLARLRSLDIAALPLLPADQRIGPCISRPGKFICIGLNYVDHAREAGREIPGEPVVFSKATSCVVGPNDDIETPRGSQKLDWEVELGVVIGQRAKYISAAEVPSVVAGYCLVNDVSERDLQSVRGGQWIKGKSHDTFGPIGPWLVTPDEAGDIDDLPMWLEVDGRRYQDGSTATMVFRVPFLIHYVSQFMSLRPGDVISTGTPPGVGMGQKPPVYLRGGEVMRLGIAGLGVQTQKVRPAR